MSRQEPVRTSEDLDTLIEGYGHGYTPTDETDSIDRVRYHAYAHPLLPDGTMNFERTASFGFEAGLLRMPEDELRETIEAGIAEEQQWWRTHSTQQEGETQ